MGDIDGIFLPIQPNRGEFFHLIIFSQEPSETDKRAVRDDPNLKGESYVGEFVISQSKIYLIDPIGQINTIGDTATLLRLKNGE
jgi:hypothetical protein